MEGKEVRRRERERERVIRDALKVEGNLMPW
jgi:hypothetical protein